MEDTTFLKVITTILLFVLLSVTAAGDSNNPLNLGIPISIDDFSVRTIIEDLSVHFYVPQTGNCNIATLCLNMVANFLYGVGDNIFSALKIALGLPLILISILLTLFLFNTWSVFQGHYFLVAVGALLTVILLGSFVLWIIGKVTGAIPFIGGV